MEVFLARLLDAPNYTKGARDVAVDQDEQSFHPEPAQKVPFPKERFDLLGEQAQADVIAPVGRFQDEDGDRPGVRREQQCGLSRRVSAADDEDILAMDRKALGGGGPVIDAATHQTIEARDRQVTPRDAGGDDDGLRADACAITRRTSA